MNGRVAAVREGDGTATDVSLPFRIEVNESSWIAARVKCRRAGNEPELQAHTNAVYLHRDGAPTLIQADRDELARRWREEANYYRNAGLVFLEARQREELFASMERAVRVYDGKPRAW